MHLILISLNVAKKLDNEILNLGNSNGLLDDNINLRSSFFLYPITKYRNAKM